MDQRFVMAVLYYVAWTKYGHWLLTSRWNAINTL